MLRNSPAIIGKYGRDIMNIWESTFLVENNFNFKMNPVLTISKSPSILVYKVKWKGTDLLPVASDFMTSFFKNISSL